MTDLTVEQRQAAADLDTQELVFANLWLDTHNNGLRPWQCAEQAYPNQNRSSLITTASRLLNHNNRVRHYIDTMNKNALKRVGVNRATLISMLQRQATTAEQALGDHIEHRTYTLDNGDVATRPWAENPHEWPSELKAHLVSFRPAPDGDGFVLDLRELVDEKTRQKAVELLAKMGGELTERVELSGGVVNASVELDASDPLKAAAEYTALMRGLDDAAGKR
jgi:hypothetical protein